MKSCAKICRLTGILDIVIIPDESRNGAHVHRKSREINSGLLYGRESVQNKQGIAEEDSYRYICFSLRKSQKWVPADNRTRVPPSLCPLLSLWASQANGHTLGNITRLPGVQL